MRKDFIDSITDDEIENIGLKVLNNGREKYGSSYFLQCCDPERILNDGNYTCHYEILHMGENDSEHGNHKKNMVYIEIHFEHKKYSKNFKPVLEKLTTIDEELELFNWRSYCPGIRLKNSVFNTNQKQEILENLRLLKDKTLDVLLTTYKNILPENGWQSDFKLASKKRTTASSRNLSPFIREPGEIEVFHEIIKENLINTLKGKPTKLGKEYPIDTKTLSDEHEVNKINYIDLVAQTTNGKIVFFEIKTASEARLCIRQALGQLMEYAFFPDVKHADLLVVVGTGSKTENIESYIKKLNSDFKIHIDYLRIPL